MTSKPGEHGTLGSNQPLERVPVPADSPSENEEVEENVPEGSIQSSTPTSSTTEDDGDVVYLREDLRR